MCPGGPPPSFHWLQWGWVEMEGILKVIQPPTARTGCEYIHENI
jgi:hypothetical protein